MNAFELDLLTEAAKTYWYDDNDDRQFTIKPARLNTLRGSRTNYYSFIGEYNLPDTDNFYVLYELGQVSPSTLGVETNIMTWIALDALSLMNDLFINVHINHRMLPLTSIYILRDNRKNIILAVDAKVNRVLLNSTGELYLRVYSNNWLAEVGQATGGNVGEIGGLVSVIDDVLPVITANANTVNGNKFIYHNGFYVNDVTPGEVNIGDTLCLLWDGTGRGYWDIPLSDLKSYQSEMDSLGKYLIQLPIGAGGDVMVVEPGDELEIYICNQQPNVGTYARVKGFYYTKLLASDLRMLTHRDFGLNATRIEAMIDEHDTEFDLNAPFLRIFLRNHTNGIHKPGDGNYINDLMRVDKLSRESLMVGTAGTYPGWRPSNLEQSPLLQWQQSNTTELTLSKLKGVYSIEELNEKARTGRLLGTSYQLPPIMVLDGKVLCFDMIGKLINIIDVMSAPLQSLITVPQGTVSVECIPGVFTETGTFLDRDTDYTDTAGYWDEQYYFRTLDTDKWTLAIIDVDYSIDSETGTLQWAAIHETDARMRRTIEDGIYRQLMIEPEMIYHPISIYNGEGPATLMPLARTDVYLDGRRCVEGIDFTIDYPFINITNKEYYLDSTSPTVQVDIFHHGIPDGVPMVNHWGFIRHSLLRDTDPDIFFQDRDMEYNVDGYKVSGNDLGLFETPDVVTDLRYREGGLYSVVQRPYLLGPWARQRLAHSDLTLERKASGAVSKLMRQVVDPSPVYIPYGHAVYSPWIKRTIVRIRSGEINISELGTSTTAVTMLMAPYIDELSTDILNSDIDWGMVDVHPTPNLFQVDITEEELLFLRTLNQLYCNNRLTFNTYVNIQQ